MNTAAKDTLQAPLLDDLLQVRADTLDTRAFLGETQRQIRSLLEQHITQEEDLNEVLRGLSSRIRAHFTNIQSDAELQSLESTFTVQIEVTIGIGLQMEANLHPIVYDRRHDTRALTLMAIQATELPEAIQGIPTWETLSIESEEEETAFTQRAHARAQEIESLWSTMGLQREILHRLLGLGPYRVNLEDQPTWKPWYDLSPNRR